MNRYARLDYSENSEVVRERRSGARKTIIRTLIMVVIAGVVVLTMVVESRLSPELRQELLYATHVYP
jgi:hypothetical protein